MRLPFNGWMVAAALGSALVGLGAWDLERAIAKLDSIDANTREIDKQGDQNKNDIADLKPRVGAMELTIGDHERRIIRLEPRP